MRKSFFLDFRRTRPPDASASFGQNVSFPMFVLFVLGVFAGAVAGLYLTPSGIGADLERYVFSDVLPHTFWDALWNSGKFFLLLFALSTSWLGVFLTPAAALLRGYLFSCSVAAFFSAFGTRGLLCAALVSGIPALFIVPCFLTAASDAILTSRHLLELRFDRGPGFGPVTPARHLLLIPALVLLDALYSFLLLPRLLPNL